MQIDGSPALFDRQFITASPVEEKGEIVCNGSGKWIELLRVAERRQCFISSPLRAKEEKSVAVPGESIVGIQSKRLLPVGIGRRRVLVQEEAYGPQRRMRLGRSWVKLKAPARCCLSLPEARQRRLQPVHRHKKVSVGKSGPGAGEADVARQSLFVVFKSPMEAVLCSLVPVVTALQEELICFNVVS